MSKRKLCILALVIVSMAYSRENLNIEDFSEIEQPRNDGLLCEIQPLGLFSNLFAPSRIASISYLFGSGISIKVDPIIGLGEISGYGSSIAFHIGKNEYKNGLRFGIRYAIAKVNAANLTDSESSGYIEPAGYINEFYAELLSYYQVKNTWRWHWGASIGRGISSVGSRSDMGRFIETGATLRAEIGIGKIIFK